jgi:hypothetical protein
LQREISRLKSKQEKSNKIGTAKAQLRELKYGKYFKPGRKIVATIGKSGRKAGGWMKKQASSIESSGGGFGDPIGGLEFGNPLENIGNPFSGISMGNPFGEPERRTIKHHRRKQRVKVIYKYRPKRRRYYYR